MVTRAWIEMVSHGAKAGTVPCTEAVTVVRDAASEAKGADARRYREMAEALAAPPGRTMACVIQGWGGLHLVFLDVVPVPVGAIRDFGDEDARELHAYTVACRDRERALAILRKCLDKAGSSAVAAPLAELVAFASDHWEDCDGILARLRDVMSEVVGADAVIGPGRKLRAVMTALSQATLERKRGGAINATGGDV
jgi:hypothetical protein